MDELYKAPQKTKFDFVLIINNYLASDQTSKNNSKHFWIFIVPSCRLNIFLQDEIRFGNCILRIFTLFGLIIIILGKGQTLKYN